MAVQVGPPSAGLRWNLAHYPATNGFLGSNPKACNVGFWDLQRSAAARCDRSPAARCDRSAAARFDQTQRSAAAQFDQTPAARQARGTRLELRACLSGRCQPVPSDITGCQISCSV
ncbi:hypothetical protein VNO78_08200 [Psophocarpus tetragonolobus]|uniref:Uncharacterized protein n=1 Tax=Psophocarpus tetragonolobus TaxID=3891 RepID=A0AAN9SUJ6_PSOTE